MLLLFKNTKLKTKLLISHGVIIFFLVILAVVSFFSLQYYNNRFFGYSSSSEIITRINTIHGNVYKAFTYANTGISKDLTSELIGKQKEAIKSLSKDVKRLSGNGLFSQREKDFYEVAYKNIIDYDKIINDAFDIATADPTIASLYLVNADNLFTKVVANLDNLFQYEKSSIKKLYLSAIIIISVTAVFSIILSFFLTLYVSSLITVPILSLRDMLGNLSEGDLTKRISVKTGDELQLLSESFNSFADKIENMISVISQSIDNITYSSGEISKGNQNLAARTEVQSANIENTSASLDEICASINQIGTHIDNANSKIDETKNVTSSGVELIKITIADASIMLASSTQIDSIIKLIQSIAFQVNILALNASVEAARVGEEGRGFMVVASEVKKLASSTAASVKEITDLIQNSIQSINSVSQGVNKTEGIFSIINSNIQNIAQMMKEINNSTKEQRSEADRITKAMDSIGQMTQQNSALVEESAAATEELFDRSENLSTMIAFFKFRLKDTDKK